MENQRDRRVSTLKDVGYEKPWRQFVKDFFTFANRELEARVKHPTINVLLVLDELWDTQQYTFNPNGLPASLDWNRAVAAAVYLPSTFEDRLGVMNDLSKTHSSGEADKYLDFDAWILLRRPTLEQFEQDETASTEKLYLAMAAACCALIPLVQLGNVGVSPVFDGDKFAAKMLPEFRRGGIKDEKFENRYAPQAPE
jgi:hypothetical protein